MGTRCEPQLFYSRVHGLTAPPPYCQPALVCTESTPGSRTFLFPNEDPKAWGIRHRQLHLFLKHLIACHCPLHCVLLQASCGTLNHPNGGSLGMPAEMILVMLTEVVKPAPLSGTIPWLGSWMVQ